MSDAADIAQPLEGRVGSLPAGLRDGDEGALRELVRSLAPQAFALAQRVAGATAAEAVVEEVFLLAWREPQRWSEAAFELELLRCVRDAALAVRRRGISAAAAAGQLESAAGQLESAAGQLESAAAAFADGAAGVAMPVSVAEQERVRAALFALDDRQRELLLSAWLDGAGEAEEGAALTEALARFADAIEASA